MNHAREPWLKVVKADAEQYDDATLGRWVRLKALADDTWPAAAPVPRWCKPSTLAALSDRLELSGDYYRVPELDRERERQQAQARTAAETRWRGGAARNADGNAASNTAGNAQRRAYQTQTQTETQPQLTSRNSPPTRGSAVRVDGPPKPVGATLRELGIYPPGGGGD